jgi:chromosome segregation ATPase
LLVTTQARAREECEEVLREKAAMRGHISGLEDAAAEREKSISMLKWTVGDLTRQLDAASGDMDMAAQIQSRHAGDGERAHELLEGLKAELRDSQAAQASAREEIRAMDEVEILAQKPRPHSIRFSES